MTFGIEDFHDLIRLLETRPEWRADLRRLVLSEELLALPEQIALFRADTERRFQELTEAQSRTDARIAALTEAQSRTDARIAALTEAQNRTDAQLVIIGERLAALTEAQSRTDARIAALTEAQNRTDAQLVIIGERLAALTEAQNRTDAQIAALTDMSKRHDDSIGDLKGEVLEVRYQRNASAYVGRLVRRAQVLSANELMELLENAVDQGLLTEEEKNDVSLTDVIVRGRRKEDGAPVYLAIEVSWGVGPYDVERAVHRAALLSRLGVPAIPVVAGKSITPDADDISRSRHVQQLIRND
jgi:chromosome segregation ATPase